MMMSLRVSPIFLALMATTGLAQGPSHHGQLPIDLPKDAHVNFEVDAPASELVPFVGLLLASGGNGGSDLNSKTIDIKTFLGTIHLQQKDLVEFLKPIRELHLVSFNGDSKDSAIDHYEHEFSRRGMKRVANVGGSNSVLVMRQEGEDGRYLAVVAQGNRITVVRTDGLPDLGSLGQLALEKLTEAGGKIKNHLKL